jgi:hypothetical protein
VAVSFSLFRTLLLALCLAASCQRCSRTLTDDRPVLGSVVVTPISAVSFRGAEVRLSEATLKEQIKTAILQSAVFAEAHGSSAKQTVANVSLWVDAFGDGTDDSPAIGVKVRLRISMRPEGSAPAHFNEDIVGAGQLPLTKENLASMQIVFQRLAGRTAGDLLRAYVARQKLWTGGPDEVAKALSSSDFDLRLEALNIIGARKMREHVPMVLHLLTDDDESIRDAALGALVELRDRRAVKALAESRPMRDTREMRKVLDAIATLGGQEAKDYLAFVAETHDDEEIRSMAKEALERMKKQAAPDQPTK